MALSVVIPPEIAWHSRSNSALFPSAEERKFITRISFKFEIFYPQMRQVLEFRQIWEFKIKRVDDEPAVNGNRNNDNPQHRHDDVVKENQIVDNCKEQACQESECGEDSEAPQPRNNLRLVFLRSELKFSQNNFLQQFKPTNRKRWQWKFHKNKSISNEWECKKAKNKSRSTSEATKSTLRFDMLRRLSFGIWILKNVSGCFVFVRMINLASYE